MTKFFIPQLNSKWGRLTIISDEPEITYYKSGAKRIKYLCQCDCGKQLLVKKHDLKTGHTKSCGCFRIDSRQLEKGESGLRRLFYEYKQNATVRKLSFSLSIEKFSQLTKDNCFYCGSEPKSVSISNRTNPEHGKYVYNGIDRYNNDIGYSISNCITSCVICNLAKKDMSCEDFLNWIRRVYKHQETKNV